MAEDLKAEMLRFGIIRDVDAPYQQRLKEIRNYYDDRRSYYTDRVRYYMGKGNEEKVKQLETRWSELEQKLDARLNTTQERYDRELERQQEDINSPIYRKRLSEAQLKETREKAAVAQEKMRQEQEVMQREEGERQAARFRARGGGRAGARPMLATARMAPQQTMAPGQTLGTFMPK